jgi:precorrin-6B methylase 2
MVIHAVLIENLQTAQTTLEKNGFSNSIIQAHLSRSHKMPYGSMLKSENPVWIITGRPKL